MGTVHVYTQKYIIHSLSRVEEPLLAIVLFRVGLKFRMYKASANVASKSVLHVLIMEKFACEKQVQLSQCALIAVSVEPCSLIRVDRCLLVLPMYVCFDSIEQTYLYTKEDCKNSGTGDFREKYCETLYGRNAIRQSILYFLQKRRKQRRNLSETSPK